ncbi:MAG: hypothetical protein WDA71_01065 [Actinomycetota bacterium]
MNAGSAIWAAIAASIVMGLVLQGARATGLTQLHMMRFLGSMGTVEQRGLPLLLGWTVHILADILFGFGYAAVFQLVDSATLVGWGMLLGLGHAAVILGPGFPLLGLVNSRVRSGEIKGPGFLGRNCGWGTVPALLFAGVCFGAVMGALYSKV